MARGRIERRTGSTEYLSDSVANFQRSLANLPVGGVPRSIEGDGTARGGEVLMVSTGASTARNVVLDANMQHGEVARVVNDGTGSVTIFCPPGKSLVGGDVILTINGAYGSCDFTRVDQDRYLAAYQGTSGNRSVSLIDAAFKPNNPAVSLLIQASDGNTIFDSQTVTTESSSDIIVFSWCGYAQLATTTSDSRAQVKLFVNGSLVDGALGHGYYKDPDTDAGRRSSMAFTISFTGYGPGSVNCQIAGNTIGANATYYSDHMSVLVFGR